MISFFYVYHCDVEACLPKAINGVNAVFSDGWDIENPQTDAKSKGINQESLAHECEFPTSQIGRIERGEINTSISHVAKIAEVLGISASDLFLFK